MRNKSSVSWNLCTCLIWCALHWFMHIIILFAFGTSGGRGLMRYVRISNLKIVNELLGIKGTICFETVSKRNGGVNKWRMSRGCPFYPVNCSKIHQNSQEKQLMSLKQLWNLKNSWLCSLFCKIELSKIHYATYK